MLVLQVNAQFLKGHHTALIRLQPSIYQKVNYGLSKYFNIYGVKWIDKYVHSELDVAVDNRHRVLENARYSAIWILQPLLQVESVDIGLNRLKDLEIFVNYPVENLFVALNLSLYD